MHAPWILERRGYAPRLSELLAREGMESVFVSHYHEKPNVSQLRCIQNIHLQARHRRWTHVHVLADDMKPAVGAGDALRWMVDEAGLTFISPHHRIENLGAKGHWARGSYVIGSAYLMPIEAMDDWMTWVGEQLGTDATRFTDEELLGAWAATRGHKWWTTVPSLYKHLPLESACKNRKWPAGPDYVEDVTGIDWTLGLSDPFTDHSMISRGGWGAKALRLIRRAQNG